MRRLLVTSLVALAALAAVSPAAAQSNSRAFQAVCEAQGGSFAESSFGEFGIAQTCVPSGSSFSERELETQERVCERAQGGNFYFTRGNEFVGHCILPS